MTLLNRAKLALHQFRKNTEGVMTVEMVIMLPFLFWMIATSFELFEVHRYKAARVKATYTVADMLSREMDAVDDTYMDGAKALFDAITRDHGVNQVRMSLVTYNSGPEQYSVQWSEVRGEGPMEVLADSDVADAHNELPVLQGGEELLIVESTSNYSPVIEYPGLNNDYTVNTQVFTGVRFAAQLCYEGMPCS